MTMIGSTKVQGYKLDRTIAQLEKETARYSTNEKLACASNGYKYFHGITVAREAMFVVSIEPNLKNLTVSSNGKLRGANLTDFVALVKETAGESVARVKFLIERGTMDLDGGKANYTTAYIFPLDKNGNVLGKRSDGFLVYGATAVNGRLFADPVVISEPKAAIAQK
ncbi:MAG: hypothetical protein V1827_02445 [Candidatus Micrarchaeota archaeon]